MIELNMKIRKFVCLFVFSFASFIASSHAFSAPVKVNFETNYGNFVIELYPDKAPKTVANFMQYVHESFYQGTIFHRTIQNFMIQGGGFTKDMKEKTTHSPIVNESRNGLTNDIGTIAMARTDDPNSATSQFFINVANNIPLNYQGEDDDSIGYCVFGKVISGMNVVEKISKLPTHNVGPFADVPAKQVLIQKVSLQKD